jgi:hypothetical protein
MTNAERQALERDITETAAALVIERNQIRHLEAELKDRRRQVREYEQRLEELRAKR